MNCANHPERTATAFCQSCGKPLCPECIRSADGLILCEPCFLARTSAAAGSASASGAAPAASQTGPQAGSRAGSQASAAASSGWSAVPPVPGSIPPYAGAPAPYAGTPPSPFLAGALGFIPGVGAMYNGQFIKALLHVVIFIVLIGASEHFDLAGFLIAAWVFYQVFDAAQTAAARRDGRPLPDPFGILDMSQRLGPQGSFQGNVQTSAHPGTQASHHSGGYTPSAYPPSGSSPGTAASAGAEAPVSSPAGQAPGTAYGAAPQGQPAPYGDPRWESYAPGGPPQYVRGADGRWTTVNTAPPAYAPVPQRRGEPVGAIVLIVVGLLFLLSTLGVLDVDWISRGWPVLLLLLGVWLLVRRATTPPQFPGPAGPPYAPPSPPAPAGNPLSNVPTQQSRSDVPVSDPTPADETTGSHEEDKR